MPTIDSAADVGNSADTASLRSLLPVQDFRDSSARHAAARHRRRTSLETSVGAASACSGNPNFDGTKAKPRGRVRITAVSNQAAASRPAVRRNH